jgi:hypothetical protein
LSQHVKIAFDVQHLYYLPQYKPIWRALQQRGVECELVIYDSPLVTLIWEKVAQDMEITHIRVASKEEALKHYQRTTPEWIVFGNNFKLHDQIPSSVSTAMVNHGAGIKSAGYSSGYNKMNVRFVEGPHHLAALKSDYPERNFVLTGFAKLDPLINQEVHDLDLSALGLAPDKPTILYAPTFFPSSIELMPRDLPQQLGEFNIIAKPHFFTYTKSRYSGQMKRLQQWSKASNVYLAPSHHYSIVPYLAVTNILISEASTTLFEAAALDIPIVWCDFVKLRWSYRGPFRYRYERRIDPRMRQYYDIAAHVAQPAELVNTIREQHDNPEEFSANRRSYAELLLGPCDGRAAQRVADYLIDS